MKYIFLFLIALGLTVNVFSQTDSTIEKISSFPARLILKINKKVLKTDRLINQSVDDYLNKFEKTEGKLKARLQKRDSASKYLFAKDLRTQYKEYRDQHAMDSGHVKMSSQAYIPNLDSGKVALEYLANNGQSNYVTTNSKSSIKNTIGKVKNLETNLTEATQLKEFVEKRKEQLKQYILQQNQLPSSITSLYNQYSSDYYYYSQKLQEYKETLNDPDKMLSVALQYLNTIPSFKTFVANNSFLALMFPGSPNAGTTLATNGLQSRLDLQNLLRGVMPPTPGASNAFASQVDQAKDGLSKLQDKLMKYGSGGQSLDNPDFKPNGEKKKIFLKRLQYELNVQPQHATNFIPAFINFGFGLGYKLNDANVIGVGLSYSLGLGQPISKIKLSSQGMGLRSYLDLKIKGNLFASGGMEYNQTTFVSTSTQNSTMILWQPSGLIGISKIVDLKSKLVKKSKVQILWNFLSYCQVPRAQPFVFRVGYSF